jgi:hypothetical protein
MHHRSHRASPQALYFDEVIRNQLSQIKERSRRGPPVSEWRPIWEKLELAAWVYDQGMKSLDDRDRGLAPLTPREALNALIEHRKTIDTLLQQLENPRLWNWSFVSEDGFLAKNQTLKPRIDPYVRRQICATPSLIQGLAVLRDEVMQDIKQLEQFTQRRRAQAMTADDHRHTFLSMLLDIAHELFGAEVGTAKGPLIRFVSQAAQVVLKENSPLPEALRTIARRSL